MMTMRKFLKCQSTFTHPLSGASVRSHSFRQPVGMSTSTRFDDSDPKSQALEEQWMETKTHEKI